MKYFIAVHTPALAPMADLASALRNAYDGGTDGYFRILPEKSGHFTVIFERDAYLDAEHVARRAEVDKVSIETSAMRQLGAELKEGQVGAAGEAIAESLLSGEATVFDFESGAVEFLATYKPEQALQAPNVLPDNVRDLMSALIDYAESATLEGDTLPDFVIEAQTLIRCQPRSTESGSVA